MISQNQARKAIGRAIYGRGGHPLGTVAQIFDDDTGQAEFAALTAEDHGTPVTTMVPLSRAAKTRRGLTVPYTPDQVARAPRVSPGEFGPEEQQRLLTHYDPTETGSPEPTVTSATHNPADLSDVVDGVAVASEAAEMTRSVEQLRVTSRREPYARARLRTYITTEMVSVTVPLRREYAVLETVPYDDVSYESVPEARHADDTGAVLINEEVVEVVTEIRPVARVKLSVERRTTTRTLTGQVRAEIVAVEGDAEDRRGQGAGA